MRPLAVPGVSHALFERLVLLRRQQVRADVIFGERLPHEGCGLGRERLRRPRLLERRIALRDRTFLDRPERLTGDPVEHVEESGLARMGHDIDFLAVVPDADELRRGDVVEIPEIVMHGLEVPQALAGLHVERQQAVGKEVLAGAIAAIEVGGGRPGRDVHDPALLVDRHLPPVVGAADVLVAVGRIGVVAELARPRDDVELPQQLASQHVVRADVAWRRQDLLARLAAEDHDVAPDAAGARRHCARARAFGAQQADPHVAHAVVSEAQNRFAGARVDLLEKAVDGEDQSAVLAVRRLPVVDALAGDAVQPLVHPELLARRRVQRDERARVAAKTIDHVIGVHGAEDWRRIRVEPGHLELTHVRFVDLIERVVVRAIEARLRLDLSLCRRRGEHDHGHERDGHRDGHRAPSAAPRFLGHRFGVASCGGP